MVRDSRSPPRDKYRDERRRADDRDRGYGDRSRRRYGDKDRDERGSEYGRRRGDESFRGRRRDSRERDSGYSRDTGRGERKQDSESERRPGDRDRPSGSRRSASPPRRSPSPTRPSELAARSKSKSAEPEDKAKPNFKPSGLLAAATKTVQHADGTGTVLKYHEPPEARKPLVGWRLYVFKGKEQVDLLHIHRQSAYLIGRDRQVTDIAVEHPSCSKQHAVIQFRQIQEKNEFGEIKQAVKPFVIDLESTNGTLVNDETIPTSRYFELKLGDVIKFGESAREYVLLSEDAA